MIFPSIVLLLFYCYVVKAAVTYLGHDLSSLTILENSLHATFQDSSGRTEKLEDILIAGGANSARLRIWVNPIDGDYSLDYNLALAGRLHSAGLSIYLDFHYSDTWADPGHQFKPAAWTDLDFAGLVAQAHNYTGTVVQAFYDNDIPLAFVSIGNEIRHGMLWDGPDPSDGGEVVDPTSNPTVKNYTNLAILLKAESQAIRAVKCGSRCPSIMTHVDNGWSWPIQQGWYDRLLETGIFTTADFDVQGVSYYPFYSQDAALSNLSESLTNMANRYKKPIIVAETDWPVNCTDTTSDPFPPDTANIPFSAVGQTEWVQSIISILEDVPSNLGHGIFYWEPAWLNNTGLGSECEDVLLFNQDWSDPEHPIGTARSSVDLYLKH